MTDFGDRRNGETPRPCAASSGAGCRRVGADRLAPVSLSRPNRPALHLDLLEARKHPLSDTFPLDTLGTMLEQARNEP